MTNGIGADELEAARRLLEERNKMLVAEERTRLDESRDARAYAAARAEQDSVRGPALTPGGIQRGPDLEALVKKHLDRLDREDARSIEGVRARLDAEKARLDSFVHEYGADGRTSSQLAREALEPLREEPPHSTRSTPMREFNLDARNKVDLDKYRTEIEHNAARDDARQQSPERPLDVFNTRSSEETRRAEFERKREELLRQERERALERERTRERER